MKAKQGTKAVAYYRVSTREQGDSHLGLEAQKHAVKAFCDSHGYLIIGEHEEVESGKRNDRPHLDAAIAKSKAAGAKLLIAKLDRLSRDVEFIFHLRNTGVDFVAVDLPEANTLTISLMAAMAQHERELISSRTKAALDAKKARGETWDRGHIITAEARQKAYASRRQTARARANGALRAAVNYRDDGHTLAWIAEQLNKGGSTTRDGHDYTPTTVQRLLRMAEAEA
jgi:DNA invertase Pin-like site-specific DNA recombinase